MSTPRLSPAMRNALFAICHGGLRNHSVLPAATQQTLAALQQRGLIDQQGNPTEAGRAVFAPLADPQERRPGINKLADRIQRANPGMSAQAVAIEAKHQYTSPREATPC